MWRFPFSSVEVSDPLLGEKGADGAGDCGFVLLFPKFINSLATSSRDSAAKCKSVNRKNFYKGFKTIFYFSSNYKKGTHGQKQPCISISNFVFVFHHPFLMFLAMCILLF